MFQVGDMVCYPMHGVGTVEAIQEQNILGETNQYYLLRFLMGRMTALVPVKNAQSVGLRPLIDEGTCGKVVEFLKSDDCSQESDNWNQRYRENLDKLKQGDALVVAAGSGAGALRRGAQDVSDRPSGVGGRAVRIQRSGRGGVPSLGRRRINRMEKRDFP